MIPLVHISVYANRIFRLGEEIFLLSSSGSSRLVQIKETSVTSVNMKDIIEAVKSMGMGVIIGKMVQGMLDND